MEGLDRCKVIVQNTACKHECIAIIGTVSVEFSEIAICDTVLASTRRIHPQDAQIIPFQREQQAVSWSEGSIWQVQSDFWKEKSF